MDDLADDSLQGDLPALDLARSRLSGEKPAPQGSVEGDFLELARERAIPPEPALELVDALREDCGPRSIRTPADLVRFAYGVAGTVGRIMRHVIGARDARADPFAIDLGIALQLSNVMRDIAEDARRDRFYLPAEWIEAPVVKRALEHDPNALCKLDNALRETHLLAVRHYESAIRGFVLIPPRNRRVIFLATALYREIGDKVMRSRMANPRERVVVNPAEKLQVALRSIRDYRSCKRDQWSLSPQAPHDHSLHAPLYPPGSLQKPPSQPASR